MIRLSPIVTICALFALCPLCLCGGIPPALDAADQRAIDLALRAIKMSGRDLSFSKTNVESELILPEARTFLQHPLAMPQSADGVLAQLRAVSNLVTLSDAMGFARNANQARHDAEVLRIAQNDNADALSNAVQRICNAAAAVQPLLPKLNKPAFDAFALETLHEARGDFGIEPELLRREEAQELQDTELADAMLNASDRFDCDKLLAAQRTLAGAIDAAIAGLRTNHFEDEFQIETESPLGKIILGGVGRNLYTNEAFLIIDLGGDDVYENSAGGANGLAGRPISIVIDLAGNDQYISRKNSSQGSGVFGIGILVDCDGDDVYEAKHLSQGASFFGCGLLADYGGQDKFAADTFAQGAAEFGTGILWQRGGDTEYRVAQMGQGFGGTAGCGLLLDGAGNDSYFAGGKYACAWLPGRYFSLSQGFGYGMRPFAGGGVGILCDLKGDDHFVADVYGQGASYWYSVGMLLDAEGNDSYQAYQYCQGAGIHLSNGALIDWSGDDTYTASHICQGAAHDYSVGMLIDRAGSDVYFGDTTAQGSAINNSLAMLLDHAGNDSYHGTDPKQSQAAGHDGEKREYGSIALMLDLAGKDSYSQGQSNNDVRIKPLYGVGVDVEARSVEALKHENLVGAAFLPRPESPTKRLYAIEPVNPHNPIEHLLRLAISDKPDAGKAWEELKNSGTNALPYLLTRLDSPNVLVRAKTEELIDHLDTNSIPVLIDGIDHAKNDEVARLCCYFLARFNEKARAAIPHVLPLLDHDKTRPTVFYTLGHLRAREVFEPAMKVQRVERELIRLRATQALGRIADSRAIPKLIATLDDEMWDVRYAAQDSLIAIGKPSIGPLRNAFAKAPARARPHILEALARLKDRRALSWAEKEYRNEDPLVRNAVIKSLKAALDAKPAASPPR